MKDLNNEMRLEEYLYNLTKSYNFEYTLLMLLFYVN